MLMQCQRACSKIWRDQRQQPWDNSAGSIKLSQLRTKKSWEKKLAISKVRASQPLFSKHRLRTARFQKLTIRWWVKKYEPGNKTYSLKAVFSREMFSENSTKTFFAQPRGHVGTQQMMRVIRKHPLKAIFPVMRVIVNYRKGQNDWKKLLYI